MAEVCVVGSEVTDSEYIYTSPTAAKEAALLAFANMIIAEGNEGVTCTQNHGWADNGLEYIVTLEAACGSTKARADVAFQVTVETPHKTFIQDDREHTIYAYNLKNVTSKYLSYNLESTGGEAE